MLVLGQPPKPGYGETRESTVASVGMPSAAGDREKSETLKAAGTRLCRCGLSPSPSLSMLTTK